MDRISADALRPDSTLRALYALLEET